MVEVDHTPEHDEAAGVVYSVLTSLRFEVDSCLDELHSRKAIGMSVVEAGARIRSVGYGYCSHWRMREGRVVT